MLSVMERSDSTFLLVFLFTFYGLKKIIMIKLRRLSCRSVSG